jgi:hypothetical protein
MVANILLNSGTTCGIGFHNAAGNAVLGGLATNSLDILIAGGTPISAFTAIDQSGAVLGGARRNRLFNGGFVVNQRGITAPTDDTYVFDRWYVLTQSNAITVGQQTAQEAGQSRNIRLTQSDASAQRMGLAQIVPSTDSVDLRSVICSLQARVRISNSQAIRFAILEWTGTADSVTSDVVNDWTSTTYTAGNFFVSSVAVVTDGTITPSSATWSGLSSNAQTNPVRGTPSASANNLIVFIWTNGTAAQNVTLDIANVQMERGATSTLFEYNSFTDALADCQAFFQTSYSHGTAPGSASFAGSYQFRAVSTTDIIPIRLQRAMRNVPVVTLYNPNDGTTGDWRDGSASADRVAAASDIGRTGFTVTLTSSVIGNIMSGHWAAEIEL